MKLSYLFFAAFCVSFFVIIFGEAGIISAWQMSKEKLRVEARVSRLEKEYQNIANKIAAVEKDPIALEYEIRKSLSLVAEDEILIKFNSD